MPDLTTAFQALDRIPAPDLWPHATERATLAPRSPQGPVGRRRLLAGALGLAIAAAAIGAAWTAVHGLGHSTPSSQSGLERLRHIADDLRSGIDKASRQL